MLTKKKKYISTKKVPIIAGGKSTGMKLKKVGYYVIEFTYDSPQKDRLISERTIKRVIY